MRIGFGIELPRITNEDLFEDFCLDIIKNNKKFENAQRNGTRGQRQNGVDIFAREITNCSWLGIQCKVKAGEKISSSEVDNEIAKAVHFNPKLSKYYFYTTAKRDVVIQEHIRKINDTNIKRSSFSVEIFFWEDIESLMCLKEYKSLHYKYYNNYYANIEEDGYSFGKLISLTVGYPGNEAYYELLIGQTYRDGKEFNGLNYWKNASFIMNMNDRTFETFPVRCHPSDLENAFRNERDRYIICEWLNSIGDIGKFLKSQEEDYKYFIDYEKIQRYFDDNSMYKSGN
jgi:hypothetical protein